MCRTPLIRSASESSDVGASDEPDERSNFEIEPLGTDLVGFQVVWTPNNSKFLRDVRILWHPPHFKDHHIGSKRLKFTVWPTAGRARVGGFQRTLI